MKVFIVFAAMLFCEVVLANRLEEAAQRGTDAILSIAQISSVSGIALGATMMAFGASGTGRSILMGGILAAVAVFGGPAFVDVLRGVFS